jgi:exopolysaccharide production protein ExoQ
LSPVIASTICAIGIVGLFYLDRGDRTRVSNALWIPTAWLFFCMSRSLSRWLGAQPAIGDAGAYLDGSPTDRALFMLLEFVAMVVVIARWRRVSPILRRNWAIGLFFLYAGLSISWSDYQLVSFKHWIKAIGDVMMVLIILTEPSVTGAFKRVVTRLGFVLLPLSILFIRYYPELGRRVTNSWTLEPTGVCDQKNSLGILCYIIGLGLLWRFRSSYNDREDPSRRRRLLALGIVLAMAVWLLHTCNSLTSICALSMASIAMLLSNLRVFRRIPALAHCLILVTLGISVYALFFQSSGALVEDLGRDRTLSGRSTGWLIILAIPHNHLVGAGYESFWLGSRLQMVWDAFPGMKIGQAHNGYIEIALNLGWVGVAMLALLIVTGYRNVIDAYRLDPDIGGLRISYFIAVLTNGLTEGIFKMMTPPWIFFLLATAIAQWIPQRKGSPAARKTHSLVAAPPYAVCEQTPIGY